MNIRDYVKEQNSKTSSKNSIKPNANNIDGEKFYNENKEQVKNLEQDLNKYKNLSQNELMAELMKEATKLKQNGSLNENTINSLKSTLAPMLTQEQNENLNNILNMIK